MKKIISLILVCIMMLSVFPAAAEVLPGESEPVCMQSQSDASGVSGLFGYRRENIPVYLTNTDRKELKSFFFNIPIGAYSNFDVTPTCGMISHEKNLGENDNPETFYSSERLQAQLLWFQQGFVEYRFSTQELMEHDAMCLTVSFEACAETRLYQNDWPSDITVTINGVELGTWCCPGDFGERRGRYTPEWWEPPMTQYGIFKNWCVNLKGCYLDNERISDVTLDQLCLTEEPFITLRIGVKPDAMHQGGINLFGAKFGDYDQDIVIRLDCMEK